jgi:hypothetical protein
MFPATLSGQPDAATARAMVTAHADIETPTAAEVYQRLLHSFDNERSNRGCLGGSSSPPSPTTQSNVRGDFLNRRQMPAIGGLPDVAKVSASGRQSLSGDFSVLSLPLNSVRWRCRDERWAPASSRAARGLDWRWWSRWPPWRRFCQCPGDCRFPVGRQFALAAGHRARDANATLSFCTALHSGFPGAASPGEPIGPSEIQ